MLALDGKRHRLTSEKVSEAPTGCEFLLEGSDVLVQGSVGAEKKDFVGWVYADPDGSEHHTVNCSIARMHLTVAREGFPDELEVTAETADGTIMAVRHRRLPIEGVQFHPESILTVGGHDLLRNFLSMVE